ncbi:MAG: YesL family protein [Lachnospiraceae bacterium]|nr:YesL family protein [Lachnospiraceae bacterium]
MANRHLTPYGNNYDLLLSGAVMSVLPIMIIFLLNQKTFIAGTASVAMYYTVHNRIFENKGYLIQTYKGSFIENFRKSTVIWLIFIVLYAFFGIDLYLTGKAAGEGSILAALYYPVLVCLIITFMWQLSATVYQARFDDSIKNIFTKGALIAAPNIGWMLFLTVFLVGALLLCRYLIFIVVILPGGYMCLVHHVFEHIYKKMGWISDSSDTES